MSNFFQPHELQHARFPCPSHSPEVSADSLIKALLSMALPTRARPSFPHSHSQSLRSQSLCKPLILIHQRADRRSKNYNPTAYRMKTTITENYQKWSHESESCVTQWSYEPCHAGPLKADRSWWRDLTECGPLEKGMVNHSSILASRHPWTVWKGKKIWHQEMSSPGQ